MDDRNLLALLAQRLGGAAPDRPLWRLIGAYWREEGRHLSSPKTRSTRRSQLLPVLRGLGRLRVSELTVARFREYQKARLACRGSRRGSTLSPTTLRNERKGLRRVFRWAVERELLAAVPRSLAQWKPPAERERMGALRVEDVDRLVQALPLWLGALVTVALYAGARIGVVLAMRWDDVDLVTGRIRVRMADTLTKKRGKPRLLSPALTALAAHRARVEEAHGALPVHVFASFAVGLRRRRGLVPYSYSYTSNTFREVARKAGVTTEDGYACLHHLRHGFFVEALHRWELGLKVAMRRAGITTLQLAMRYGKVGDAEDDDAQADAERRIAIATGPRRGPRGIVRTAAREPAQDEAEDDAAVS